METLSAELSSTLKKGRQGLTSKVDQGRKLRDEFVQELSSNFQSVRSVAQRGVGANVGQFAATTFTHAVQAYSLNSSRSFRP